MIYNKILFYFYGHFGSINRYKRIFHYNQTYIPLSSSLGLYNQIIKSKHLIMTDPDRFHKFYTDKIFKKYDKDNSNLLDRGELKQWLRNEVKNTRLKKDDVR